MHSLYLILILFTLSYPLYKSFEPKVHFYSNWKFIFPGIITSAIFFISWDIWFTFLGVWKFNGNYILNVFILNLPLEEWLFFIVVPFSCVFIYDVLNYFIKSNLNNLFTKTITLVLVVLFLIIAISNHERVYTFTTFLFTAIFLLFHLFILKSTYLGRFYLTWLICLIPFFLMNGILTSMPILIYNDMEILGIRLYTIPLEDVFYGMLNILQVITVYEWLKNKSTQQ